MTKYTDKNSYTILFATVMVLVVGALLAFLASSMKEKIAELRHNNHILQAQLNVVNSRSDPDLIDSKKKSRENNNDNFPKSTKNKYRTKDTRNDPKRKPWKK